MSWILERLKEKSTWTAILSVAGTLFGVAIKPEYSEAIIATGLAITSLVLILIKEKK